MNDVPGNPIELPLIDAHVMFRESMANLLREEPDLVLINEASSWKEALGMSALSRANIVLLGVNGPNEETVEFFLRFKLSELDGAGPNGLYRNRDARAPIGTFANLAYEINSICPRLAFYPAAIDDED